MSLTSSITASLDAAAAASTMLQQDLQQQQQLAAEGTHCPAFPGLLGTSHELLQALGLTTDCLAAAAAGTPAPEPESAQPGMAGDAAACAGKGASARKQRFTREQHAAILESVERNYAQYPSRYTELVIKEMQARFPGIELNNACVRKIKFRCAAVAGCSSMAGQACWDAA
jgi:hypothetical protein